MKVYDMDGSWYIANSPEEAKAEMVDLEGCTLDDLECVEPRPLTAAEMDRLTFYLEGNGRNGKTCSFAARYYEMSSRGQIEAGVFATSDF